MHFGRERLLVHAFRIPVLLGGAAMSCGTVLGTDDYAVSSDGPDGAPANEVLPVTFGSDQCRACVLDQCEAEMADCEAEPACRDIAACYLGCFGRQDETACTAGCADQAVLSTPRMNAVLGCTVERCASDCWSCGSYFARFGAPCGACVARFDAPEEVCGQVNACWEDEACRTYAACAAANCKTLFQPDPECRYLCANLHPDAAQHYWSTIPIASLSCSDECELGRHWECLPISDGWPPPALGQPATVILRGPVPVVEDGGPPQTTPIRACPMGDHLCQSPAGQSDLDEDGTVTFDLVQTLSPIDSFYYELRDPNAEVGAPGATTLFVPWLPIAGNTTLFLPNPRAFAAASVDSAAEDHGNPVESEKGTVVVLVSDCIGALARAELTVAAGSGAEPMYGWPPGSAAGGGIAFFVNVEPGLTSIDALLGGEPIVSAQIPVRAGAVTYVTLNNVTVPP